MAGGACRYWQAPLPIAEILFLLGENGRAPPFHLCREVPCDGRDAAKTQLVTRRNNIHIIYTYIYISLAFGRLQSACGGAFKVITFWEIKDKLSSCVSILWTAPVVVLLFCTTQHSLRFVIVKSSKYCLCVESRKLSRGREVQRYAVQMASQMNKYMQARTNSHLRAFCCKITAARIPLDCANKA